ncbi:MAG: hypothetical protein U0637_05430 [Phycisphaerales bacterium]
MRKSALVLAGIALVALAGCHNNKSSGNMGSTSGCCKEGAAGQCTETNKGSMGSVSGQKSDCCSSKAKGSMGAVSGECSQSKSSCTGK